MAKRSESEIAEAWKLLEQYRHANLKAEVTSVSRSGMSRRIRFYAATLYRGKPDIDDITYLIARIGDYTMSDDGLRIGGCGMDMRFHVISNFNCAAAAYDLKAKGLSVSWNTPEGKAALGLAPDDRIYDTYFFNANHF